MKRAEQLAWAALVGLLTIAVILLTGGFVYKFTAFWAGGMFACGQAVVVGLAAWGLMLARQAAELNELPSVSGIRREEAKTPANTFRMSLGDDTASSRTTPDTATSEVKTLDTGFQRLLVAIAGTLQILLGIFAALIVYVIYRWANQNPDQMLKITGTVSEPRFMTELALIAGLGSAGIYAVLYWITRPRRDTEVYGEATSSNFTLGLSAMIALAASTVLGYFRVSYASEIAAAVIAFFMLLQGLELIVNSLRSYSSIEELDQEAVDLQAHPLGPMLSSVWLQGLRMLFAQSVGISRQERHERGVIARMMPRALLAIVLIAIGASCIRVVQPGQVAVRERLGYAPTDKDGRLLPEALLGPGMHLSMPWPIDQLVYIPTLALQRTDVGTELHAPKEWKDVDFQFWTVRGGTDSDQADDLFPTGDAGASQLLETYIQVRWRVADPAAFYTALSHSDFYEREANETKALPVYEAMVQQCTSFAVSRTFSIHSLEQVMIGDRREVEQHCRQILQEKLDALGSGIEIAYLTIKDLHPPYWRPDRYDASEPRIGGRIFFTDNGIRIEEDPQMRPARVARGPASAFEFVISMSEFREQLVDLAKAESTAKINMAQGFADSTRANAEAYRLDKIARAHGDADRLVKMTENMDPKAQRYQLQLMEQQLLYSTAKDLFDPVNKIVVDPSVKDVEIYQSTDKGLVPVRPPS